MHLECRKASKNPFNGVSRKFKGCFKEVLMVFTDSFQGSLKGVSRKFQECFNTLSFDRLFLPCAKINLICTNSQ